MTLLFISLLPYNSVGLDFGLSCFFMWLLCFLIGWRSWPEYQCPGIRYCTLPGEVESEMPLCPSPDTLPSGTFSLVPSCLQPCISLGGRRKLLVGVTRQYLDPQNFRLEDISSPRFGTLTWPVLREREPGVCLSPTGFLDGGVTFCPAGRADSSPAPLKDAPGLGTRF